MSATATTSELIDICRRIAGMFDEHYSDYCPPRCSAGHRRSNVNPFYNRTTSGLYLEFYYSGPAKIWTPGGYWTFSGGMSYIGDQVERANELFMARLTTREHMTVRHDKWGTYGPVYAILAVDGDEIEPPGDVIAFTTDGFSETRAEWAPLAEGW